MKADAASLRLGIPEMDDDHAQVEALLARAAGASPPALPALLADVRAELAAHFEREEALLRANAFPGEFCHVAQHRMILADLDRIAKGPAAALPRALETVIPQIVRAHVATMDGMAASFLKGELSDVDFEGLRLPLPGVAS